MTLTASRCLSLLVTAALAARAHPARAHPAKAHPAATDDAPHRGCRLLLDADHAPRPLLAGRAFEAAGAGAGGADGRYRVAAEAGPTAAACRAGRAGGYPCRNVDLLSAVATAGLCLGRADCGIANDAWGWTHGASGREFALVGTEHGTAFVEVTDPYRPVVVGELPTVGGGSLWRDVKTAGRYALVVSEEKGHGMQVFDLEGLLEAAPGTTFAATARYGGFSTAHNVFVNEGTGFAYVVGSSACRGGLHMLDVRDPAAPAFAGCYSADGYTHDVQCVTYAGPDAAYRGREICFASNEDAIAIVDVTDKAHPRRLSRTTYGGEKYTHQGWLTEDHRSFLFDDELDERAGGFRTRTHVLDVAALAAPAYAGGHAGRTRAIDHNQYVRGALVYQANYAAGLNVLRIADASAAAFEEAGFFDTFPESDAAVFNGAWSTYPYFPSGNVIVSSMEGGLFVVRYAPPSNTATTSPFSVTSSSPSTEPSDSPSNSPTTSPSKVPSFSPSMEQSDIPSISFTASPSNVPSSSPSTEASNSPSNSPTTSSSSVTSSASPSVGPSESLSDPPSTSPSPSASPSGSDTPPPSTLPSKVHSPPPSASPTLSPSNAPSKSPSAPPSAAPSETPSAASSVDPSASPSVGPSESLSDPPSTSPSPSASPSGSDTPPPSALPSKVHSPSPSASPTLSPSNALSKSHSASPSASPTLLEKPPKPPKAPSNVPSESASAPPSAPPTASPSNAPRRSPSAPPSASPFVYLSSAPSASPTVIPTSFPSRSQFPSNIESANPTTDVAVTATSTLTFTNLDVPRSPDAFVEAFEAGITQSTVDVAGTTTAKVTQISRGESYFVQVSRTTTAPTTVVTVTVTQTARGSGDGADVREGLRRGLAASLDLAGVRAALDTVEMQEFGEFTVGMVTTDLGDGSDPVAESVSPTVSRAASVTPTWKPVVYSPAPSVGTGKADKSKPTKAKSTKAKLTKAKMTKAKSTKLKADKAKAGKAKAAPLPITSSSVVLSAKSPFG